MPGNTWQAAAATMLQIATICSTAWSLPAGSASTTCRRGANSKRHEWYSCERGRWRILTCFTTPFLSFTGAWGALMMPRDSPRSSGKSVRSTVGSFRTCALRREFGSSCARDSAIYRSSWRRGGEKKKRVSLARRAQQRRVVMLTSV